MEDVISRQAAIDALAEDMPSPYTPDGSHPADEGIFMAQEIYADCIQTLKELPPAQPERIRGWWIPVGGALYQCDKCGAVSFVHKFCPDCGAEMGVTT